MRFSWDERKRASTLADRRLDFADAPRFFDGRRAVHQLTPRGGEERWKTTSCVDGLFFTVVWTPRDDVIRIISMRRAHEQEIRDYRHLHGG